MGLVDRNRDSSEEQRKRKLRIAHFHLGRCNPESANGVDKTIFHLSSRQAAAGHRVAVLSLTPKPAIPIPGVDVRTYAPPYRRPRWLPSRAGELLVDFSPFNLPRRLVDDLLAAPPDVVHFHHTQVPQAGRVGRILRSKGIPYCVTLHGALVGTARDRRPWMKRLKLAYRVLSERPHLDGAAFLHAVSASDAAAAQEAGFTSPVEIIPNGIDTGEVHGVEATHLSKVIPQLAGRRVLLFLGRLDIDQKGLDVLIDAVSRDRTGLGLALVGPSYKGGRKTLEERTGALGLDDRVVFLGPAFGLEKLRLLSGADVFVHPSRWEGAPFSVLEAAACGLPAILSPIADPGGVLVRSGAALSGAPELETLEKTLAVLAALPADELRAMGLRARAAVSEEFDWGGISARLVDAYVRHCVEL